MTSERPRPSTHSPDAASSRADLRAIGSAVLRHRGRARELQQLFAGTVAPMVWLDNDGRCVDANPASRLFLRRALQEMRQLTVGDFLLAGPSRSRDGTWRALLREGTVAGSSPLRTPDGSLIPVDYRGLANVLPGRHLFVWAPALWAEDELVGFDGDERGSRSGRLTGREREVLTVLATGATVEEIAQQLALSRHTVKTHLRNAVRRLGARHRAHAVAIALRAGEI